jgi:2-oxoglutarate dehydrogenase E1 component
MSSSKNLEYKKTSFLNKSNSAFIEQMYLKFINKDSDLPESWKNYFLDIGDELDLIAKEINGPSWSPQKKRIDLDEIQKTIDNKKTNITKESQQNRKFCRNKEKYNWQRLKSKSPFIHWRFKFRQKG